MATLSKHGMEVGRIELLTSRLSFCEDGKILRNQGQGWKLYKKMKAGFSIQDAFLKHKAHQDKILAERPCYAHYKKLFCQLFSFSDRYFINEAIALLGDDVDGLWSELSDRNIHVDVEELCELNNLWKAAAIEKSALKQNLPVA